MRIQWNSEIAREILRYMQQASNCLDAGRGEVKSVEDAFADANPDSDNSVLNRLYDEFHKTISCMERLNDEFRDEIHQMQRAIEIFEDAEREISADIDHIATGVPTEMFGFDFPGTAPEPMGWSVEPRLMPVMHRFDEIPAPTWLQDLLEDPEKFNWIVE